MNWVEFLDAHNIPWVSSGPNTKKGEVSVKCPWCGDDDPSEHLGISLSSNNWGCHRSVTHRGHSPLTLIAALIGCSFGQAKTVLSQFGASDPDDLGQALAGLQNLTSGPLIATAQLEKPLLPAEFEPIKQTGLTARFWRYLEGRGFDNVEALSGEYRLKCALEGRYKDRIIIPFYSEFDLVGWTARAIARTIEAPRYLSSGSEIKTTVFNEDSLQGGGDLLFITEGPFDALKLDWYGQKWGARATCVFGMAVSLDQSVILTRLAKKFNRAVILFDPGMLDGAYTAAEWVMGSNVVVGSVPTGIEDPGSMTEKQIKELCYGFRNRD
jgi:hypothetical protein